jgi:peptidoglycan/xylan/chitin deacetylase (PgdA/CDA1 family)
VKRNSSATSDEVLNLCFHGIGTPGRPLEPEEEKYWVTVEQFEELVGVISRRPFVRITFDDGNASDAVVAMHVLRENNLTATFFVVAGRLDQPGSLSGAQARELVGAGMTVGSHGMRHRPWRFLGDAELREELVDAAHIIASVAEQPVDEVACPFGAYDRTVLGAIRRYGFRRVYTVDGGPARSSAWLQSRYTVRMDDTSERLAELLDSPRGAAWSSAVRAGKGFVKRLR